MSDVPAAVLIDRMLRGSDLDCSSWRQSGVGSMVHSFGFDVLPPSLKRHVARAYVQSDDFLQRLRIPFGYLMPVDEVAGIKRGIQHHVDSATAALPDDSVAISLELTSTWSNTVGGERDDTLGWNVRMWYMDRMERASESLVKALADRLEKHCEPLPDIARRQVLAAVFEA